MLEVVNVDDHVVLEVVSVDDQLVLQGVNIHDNPVLEVVLDILRGLGFDDHRWHGLTSFPGSRVLEVHFGNS